MANNKTRESVLRKLYRGSPELYNDVVAGKLTLDQAEACFEMRLLHNKEVRKRRREARLNRAQARA